MELPSKFDRGTIWIAETPILDSIDLEQIDDGFLSKLATEMEDVQNKIKEQGATLDDILAVSYMYQHALGIRSSNNFHMWLATRPIDVDNYMSGLNNIDNPEFSEWNGVRELRRIRSENPELFTEASTLSRQTGASIKEVFRLVKSGASDQDVRMANIAGAVLSWKLGIVTTHIIQILESRGVGEIELEDLYR